jgi:hypothetical protein
MRETAKTFAAFAALFIALLPGLVLAQTTGRLAPGTGIITGSIQMDVGGSQAGVRVAVIAIDDAIGANLVSLTETDSAGHFRLTDIPQGYYYVVAGRLSNFTYFPGGADRAKATAVAVEPAKTVSNINFKVSADSRRPPPFQSALGKSAVEYSAYTQASNERNIFTRIKLLLSFEKNFPHSELLARVYEDLVDLNIAKGDPNTAMVYGDKLLEKDPDNVWALIKVSRAYGLSQSNLVLALRYGEKAVSTVARLKTLPASQRPVMFSGYSPAEWTSTIAALDNSAKSNLIWVKQVVQWNQNAIDAAVRTRR